MKKLIAVCALALGSIALPSRASTITFDDISVAPGFAVSVASNFYASQGVASIQTILDATDALGVGDTFSATVHDNAFFVANITAAVSPPNVVLPARSSGGFVTFASDELLIQFSTPQRFVSVQTDDAPGEVPDVVRLLALRHLGGNSFEILAVDSGLDNATSAPDNVLSVTASEAFSFALIESTTELEAFDNLTFVPEPASLALVLVALAGFAFRRRRLAG